MPACNRETPRAKSSQLVTLPARQGNSFTELYFTEHNFTSLKTETAGVYGFFSLEAKRRGQAVDSR